MQRSDREPAVSEATPSSVDPGDRILAVGERTLLAVEPAVVAADPRETVRPRSRLLCAGLADLALAVHEALGGRRPDAVAHAAAMLSLLTKIEDQVIDAFDWHGGSGTDRAELRRRTRAFLAPSLQSIGDAEPAAPTPTARLAAELGQALRALDDGPALRRLLDLIAKGWAIQVEAVATLSAHPSAVPLADVDAVTRRISGAWLAMVAEVGTLGAKRCTTDDERAAIFAWGAPIQRADALADLDKDQREGLVCTSPGARAWRARPAAFDASLRHPGGPASYRLLAELGLDVAMLPTAGELGALDRRLAGLGRLPGILRWIHGFLLGRYLVHPLCVAERAPFAPFAVAWQAPIAPPLASKPCSAC